MFNEQSAGAGTYENKDSSYSSRENSTKKGFVISVGGSVFIGEKPLVDKIIDFCNMVNDLSSEFNFVLVVGGGKTARIYQASAKEMGANNFELDSIGIAITRVNAMLFTNKILDADKKIHTNFRTVSNSLMNGKIPIFGGMMEGQTSDAVAALLCEKLGFDFINLSNVDGIYDDDPSVNDEATMFRELSFNDMLFLLREKSLVPGQNLFLDLQAALIISRSKIKSFFLNGNHLENFKNCLRGNDFKGTIISEINDVIEHEHSSGEFEKIKEEKLSEPVHKENIHEDFVNHHFKDDADVEEDEEIDPRKIDFGR